MIEVIEVKENEPIKIELLPCPFCGEKGHVNSYHDEEAKILKFYISCWGDDCKINPQTGFMPSLEEAVEAWNMRGGKE